MQIFCSDQKPKRKLIKNIKPGECFLLDGRLNLMLRKHSGPVGKGPPPLMRSAELDSGILHAYSDDTKDVEFVEASATYMTVR